MELNQENYPLSGNLSAAETDALAGLLEANLTPDQIGVTHTEAPTIWKNFRDDEVTMPNSKEFGRVTGTFSEEELAIGAMQYEARMKAEVESHAQNAAMQAMSNPMGPSKINVARNDVAKNNLFNDQDDEADDRELSLV